MAATVLCVGVMAAASYFFPEIAKYMCKEERIGNDPCLLSVEIAVYNNWMTWEQAS